jgi:acetyltransferase
VCRPIGPQDAAIEQEFVRALSPESRYFRFMAEVGELSPELLARFTRIDYPHDLALIVIHASDGREREIAVARYIGLPEPGRCEFALVVADAWQGHGIGYRLMQTLMRFAREAGFASMEGYVLAANHKMLELMRALGFSIGASGEGPAVRIVRRTLE